MLWSTSNTIDPDGYKQASLVGVEVILASIDRQTFGTAVVSLPISPLLAFCRLTHTLGLGCRI